VFAHWDWDSQVTDGQNKKLEGNIYTYVLANTKFCAPYYGYERIKDFKALVKQGMIRKEEYENFYKDIVNLSQNGEYFYAITMYIYVGRKI